MKINDLSARESKEQEHFTANQPVFDPETGSFTPSFVYNPADKHAKSGWTAKRKIFTVSSLLVVGLLAFVGVKIYASTNRVIQRNSGIAAQALKGDLKLTELKGEGEGRVNILLLGTGDQDHAGAELSDTIMVMSLDPKTDDVAMLSLPRDMYVKIPDNGYNRINAAHALGEQTKTGSGPELAKKTVSQTLDIPIHYFVRVDFTGLKKAVDAVGGVQIDVPEALYDSEYPCDKNPNRMCGFSLKAGKQQMNGDLALKYVRCRKGSCGADFGRAARQQQVLIDIRQKATSAAILTNPVKLSAMFDAVGQHLRTDLQLDEIQKLVEISKKVDQNKIVSKVIDEEENGFLVGANVGGASVLMPKTGNYKQIQAFARSIFINNYIKGEAAKLAIENATYRSGLGDGVAEMLKTYNYTITTVVNAPTKSNKTAIYDYTNGKKPYTIKYLENRLGVKSLAAKDAPGSTANTDQDSQQSSVKTDIKIILGADYLYNKSTD